MLVLPPPPLTDVNKWNNYAEKWYVSLEESKK